MWWVLMAHAEEPVPAALPEVGTLRIETIDTGTWAMEMWRRAVARIERQWRRATRRSETPIAEPELPTPEGLPLEGVSIELARLEPHERHSCVTDIDGICTFEIAAGVWNVTVSREDFATITVESVLVQPGRTKRLPVRMEPGEFEDIVITMNLPLRSTPEPI